MFQISQAAGVLFPLTMGSSFEPTVKQAIVLQAKFGFHYPSTGEIAVGKVKNMARPFLYAFDGINIKDEEAVIQDKLKIKTEEEIRDLDIIKEISQAKTEIDKLTKAGKYAEFQALKVSITSIDVLLNLVVDDTDSDIEAVLSKYVEGLIIISELAIEAGGGFLSYDMPFWTRSDLYHNEILKASKTLFSQLRAVLPDNIILGIHSCGEHTADTLKPLLELPVDVLDLEFAHHPRNFDSVENDLLRTLGKSIKIGLVTREQKFVESEQEVRRLVTRILSIYDAPIIAFGPDCALRGLPRNVGIGKMKMLQEARNFALEIYGG